MNMCGELNAIDVEFDDCLSAGAFTADERLGAESTIEPMVEKAPGSPHQPTTGPRLFNVADTPPRSAWLFGQLV